MDKLVESKNPNAARVRVLATTPPYYDYNWTVRPGMDATLVKRLSQAFLKLDPADAEHRDILSLQRASRFIPTESTNYDGIEAAGKAAGLLK
jgi:phosphonate transport system substrate-binding protein